MSKVVLNGEKQALSELLQIVLDGARVEFDAGFMEKVRVTAPEGSFAASSALKVGDAAGTKLGVPEARSATLGSLLKLAHVQSGVRTEALEWIAALLQNPRAPLWSTGTPCDLYLAAVARDGAEGVPPLAGPGFSDSELDILRLGGGSAAGRILYSVWRARELASNSDAVSALTAEALSADVLSSVDTEWSDVRRPHPGQKAAAERLRLLLSASTRAAPAKGKKGKAAAAAAASADPSADGTGAAASSSLPSAVQFPHEISGPVSVCLRAALASARVESAAAPAVEGAGSMAPAAARSAAAAAASKEAEGKLRRKPCSALSVRPYHAAQLLLVATQATDATGALRDASTVRAASVATGRSAAAPSAGVSSEVTDLASGARVLGGGTAEESLQQLEIAAAALEGAVTSCAAALAAELVASDGVLCAAEEQEARDTAAKLAGKADKVKASNERLAKKIADTEAALADMEDGKEKKKLTKKLKKDKEALEKSQAKLAGGAGAGGAAAIPSIGLGRGSRAVRELLHGSFRSAVEGEGEGLRVPVLGADAASAVVDTSVDRLARLARAQGGAGAASGAGAGGGDAVQRPSLRQFCEELYMSLAESGSKVKVARGARDFMPEQMAARELCFTIIRNVFKRHGAVEIDTPVFELRSTLMGKYGEEGGKLIYDLADQGGELLSLRYDLTVPFARFLAQHGVNRLKRYHIARVYRRDNPQIQKGRYREFYQCDFDVAGEYPLMMPDADVLKVACEILGDLPIGGFKIKLNHRGLLDGILDMAGVPAAKFRTICSAIDKLDKEPWSAVMEEMTVEKGLPAEVAGRIESIIMKDGKPRFGEPKALLQELIAADTFAPHVGASKALEELGLLFEYLDAMGCLDRISFDLTLARGLDYYTGVIYEAVLTSPSAVGSIAAGGRYDNLVGMFYGSDAKQVPCVGVSIGIERIFTIMEQKMMAAEAAASDAPEIVVASIDKGLEAERFRVCAQLWREGFRAETKFATNLKLGKALQEALEQGRRFLVFFGSSELEEGKVKVKDLVKEEEVLVNRGELAATLVGMGAYPQSRAALDRAREISRLADAKEDKGAAGEEAGAASGGAGQ